MAEAIVSIVVGRLSDLLIEEGPLLHGVRDKIQQVVTELKRMKTFLRDADSRINEYRVRILVAEIRELVYDAEDVVESFLLKALSSERHTTQGGIRNKVKELIRMKTYLRDADYAYHSKFNMKIKRIQTRMQILSYLFRDYNIRSTLEVIRESSSSSYETPPAGKLTRFYSVPVVEPEIFVGLQEDVKTLVKHLVNGSDDSYPVIFIGGMGGLGKTTLATKIYNHSIIKTHFPGLAWVSISQKWQTKRVLQRILICLVHGKQEEILGMEVDKLVENLIEIQQMKNCFIVLDDIWSNEAWDSLKAAFPNETSRSKLLLTGRNLNVAHHVNSKCLIHQPQVLNAEQSWELLRLKALPHENYLELRDAKKIEELGREMVQKCAGLPLAIVVLGGILVTKPSLIEWEKVYYDSLSSLKRGKGLGEVSDILNWSYNVLPTQLKLCFLYMGKYREDEEIEAETLYQLWIAEGMVLSSDKREEETMMEVAESYMGELVHKSMVRGKFEDDVCSQRKFKSFRLHDLMRDLSISIAEEEDFDPSVGLKSSSTRQLVVHFDEGEGGFTSINEVFERKRPLNHFLVSKSNQRRVRTVLMFVHVFLSRSLLPILGSHVANFKLLRVFALEGYDIDTQSRCGSRVRNNIGKVLGSLIYLRYLSVRNTNLSMFPSIQRLKLLQTLNLDIRDDIYFPPGLSRNILGKLKRLRHLYLPQSGVRNLGNNLKLGFDGLSKLETLENFDSNWCEVKDLPKLINLQKLALNVENSINDLQEVIKYLASSSLRYLELSIFDCSLQSENGRDILRELLWDHNFNQKLTIYGELPELAQIYEQQQQQLHNTHTTVSLLRITSLRLSGSCLKEDPMPVLEKIPTMRELSLGMEAFVGNEMVCSATYFPKLTQLELGYLSNLEKWRVEEGSMPILSHLSICHCCNLEELPEGLRFLNSLGNLILRFMPSDFCDRVRLINGELGPDFYKVSHVSSLQIR